MAIHRNQNVIFHFSTSRITVWCQDIRKANEILLDFQGAYIKGSTLQINKSEDIIDPGRNELIIDPGCNVLLIDAKKVEAVTIQDVRT